MSNPPPTPAALRETARRAEAAGQLDAAERDLRAAYEADPGDGQTVFALAELLTRRQRYAEAEGHYQTLLQAFPDHPALLNALALHRQKTGRQAEARELWQRLHVLQPGNAAPLVNAALSLRSSGDKEAALALLQRAVAVDPASFDAHFNLGSTYYHASQIDMAIEPIETALKLRPDDTRASMMHVQICQALCDWDELERMSSFLAGEVAKARAGQPCAIQPPYSLRLPLSRADRKAIATVAAQVYDIRPPRRADEFSRVPGQKLTLGYMSQDFRHHAVLQLTAGLYRRHDRGRFRVLAYPVRKPDEYGHAVLKDCDQVTDLTVLSDHDAARRIAEDKVDILVDLSVMGVFTRPGILALRPAPIQVSWPGFTGTMNPAYDYFIGDRLVTPPEYEADFLETIARLPHSHLINNRDQAIDTPPSRRSVGLPETGVVFACFCGSEKVERQVFYRWMDILRQCPGSVLWQLGSSPRLQQNLRREAQGQGIDPARVVFAGYEAKPRHLARLSLADMHLDTGTFGAHMTGCDALWAGVPLLTVLGDTMPSRVAASVLRAVGLPELVAPGWDDYVRIAVELGRSADHLAALKAKLAANRLTTPLFDTDRFVEDLERLYEKMWSRFAAGEKPAPLDP